ncbi:MAG: TonB-dependent receptor plug domain-containing protein, partial [Bacteroides sp.]
PEISDTVNETSAIKVNDLAAIVETKVKEMTGEQLVRDTLKSTPLQPATVKATHIREVATVVATPLVPATTVKIDSVRPQVRAIGAGVQKDIVPTIVLRGKPDPLLIVDGEEIFASKLETIPPDWIESISVLKDKTAVSIYGEKAKHGVILLTLKEGVDKSEWLKKKGAVAKGAVVIGPKDNPQQYSDSVIVIRYRNSEGLDVE